MKQLFLLFICLLTTAALQAQDTGDDYYNRRDSLRAIDRDTANSMINVGIIGDVISGYAFTVEPAYPDPVEWTDTFRINGLEEFGVSEYSERNRHPYAFRWYHIDRDSNRVRQIVVLRQQWHNLPDDLRSYTETGKTITTGFRLAALTPREYREVKKQGMVWGEVFEAAWPDGITNHNRDTMPNVPGMEIVCYNEDSLPVWKLPYGPVHRLSSCEIMTYEAGGKTYLCAAPNPISCSADYTQEGSDGRYECRWMLCSDKEEEYWWEKYYNWIKKNRFVQAVYRWWKEV